MVRPWRRFVSVYVRGSLRPNLRRRKLVGTGRLRPTAIVSISPFRAPSKVELRPSPRARPAVGQRGLVSYSSDLMTNSLSVIHCCLRVTYT